MARQAVPGRRADTADALKPKRWHQEELTKKEAAKETLAR